MYLPRMVCDLMIKFPVFPRDQLAGKQFIGKASGIFVVFEKNSFMEFTAYFILSLLVLRATVQEPRKTNQYLGIYVTGVCDQSKFNKGFYLIINHPSIHI